MLPYATRQKAQAGFDDLGRVTEATALGQTRSPRSCSYGLPASRKLAPAREFGYGPLECRRPFSGMATLHLVPDDLRRLYHVHEWRNAAGILKTACTNEWKDILAVLREFRLLESEVRAQGGNRSLISRRLDSGLYRRGWIEKDFATAIMIDNRRYESPTHKIDCFKGRVALEIEWNNKDPFFDRDLNNFRLLFELRAVDVGVIVTRGVLWTGDDASRSFHDWTAEVVEVVPC
jgi:hypothetical protein